MKRKIFLCTVIATMIVFFTAFPVSAYMPTQSFWCDIVEENIPDNTAFVDLLLPISTEDEGYVNYNKSNGKKFGISENSGIVSYCEDDYRSYTFHIVDADAEIIPYDVSNFAVDTEVYLANQELFEEIESFRYSDPEIGREHFSVEIILGGDLKQTLEEIGKVTDIDMSFTYCGLHTAYNSYGTDNRKSDYDFSYCCDKYKYAKMAYLDKDGNVLAVSNEVLIDIESRSGVTFNLELSGTEFTNDFSYGPPWYLVFDFINAIPCIIIGTLIFVVLVVITVIVVIIRVRKSKKKS